MRIEWKRVFGEQGEKCRLPVCFVDITGSGGGGEVKASVTVFRATRTVIVPIDVQRHAMVTRGHEKQYRAALTESMATDIITRFMSLDAVATYLRENFIADYEAVLLL